ncbi:GNAT family N-acetyltransferase [Acinetobacter sp. ULE_I010]|uniref:GNAT family N-acetyltransferase n=1 Tax=Acinetobacter sp. ULE_I010 TaxID=3373065 RepID=UPI003AF72E26
MEMSSNLSNYSNNSQQYPIINDGTAPKAKAKFLEDFPTIKPHKYQTLSNVQISSFNDFACGNTGIDTFLRHGEGLKFQVDRNKMDSMIMATETQVLGYMAYSLKELTFSIPKMCSQNLKELSGLKAGDKIFCIHYLGVDESCKNKGLAESLVLKALNFCIKKAATTEPSLKLIVLHATIEACGFYEKMGFDRIGELDNGLIEYAYTVKE